MHILLLFSYAFSLWMLIDAYQRGAPRYWTVIILMPFGEWVYFFMVKIEDFQGPPGARAMRRMPCVSCRFRQDLDQDGVICGAGPKPLFKTPIHIKYCTDYMAE